MKLCYCTGTVLVQYCTVTWSLCVRGALGRNVSIGRRAVVARTGDMKSYSQYETH